MQLTEEQRAELAASMGQANPQPFEVPSDMTAGYESALEDDQLSQGIENSLASMAGRNAAKVGSTAGLKKAEIDQYLKQVNTGDKASTAQQTGYVVKGTNIPVVYEGGKYWYTNDDGTRDLAKNVEKIGARKDKSKGGTGGKGAPKEKKLKQLSAKESESIATDTSILSQLDDLEKLEGNLPGSWSESKWDQIKNFASDGHAMDADYHMTKADITNLTGEIRSRLAGANVTEPERRFLRGMLPEIDMSKTQFNAQIKAFKKRFRRALLAQADVLKKSGRDLTGFGDHFTNIQAAYDADEGAEAPEVAAPIVDETATDPTAIAPTPKDYNTMTDEELEAELAKGE